MATIPPVFPYEPDMAIVSYSFIDVTEGVGYVNFYPCAFKLSGSTTYGMAQSTDIHSGIIATKVNGAAPAASDVNYDLKFNLPQRIRGNVLLSFSLGTAVGNGGTGATGMVVAKLYKVSDATTQLGSTITSTTSGGSAGDTTIPVLMKFDLSDQVYTFKKGDILRINIYLSGVGGTTSASGYGSAPAATADSLNAEGVQVILSGYTTRMILAVPFVLER